ncbi:DUF3397 domain-containing protein [Enterococcus sp. LJL98]
MPSITLNLLFWYFSPIFILFSAQFATSVFSLKKRFGLRSPDIAVPFLFLAIHRLSFLTFKESLFPYFLITLCLLGIGLAFFQSYFYEELDYPRYFKMYWRSVFLFSILTQVVLIIMSVLLSS